jgi:NADH-quinone oxidoreductase subunit J
VIEENGIVIAFWILSASTIGCALMVAAVRNLIHSVLFLALTFVGVAGIYICLSADFVAVVQVLIYAGAVGVLMTFAIMLTPGADRLNASTAFQAPALVLSLMKFLVIFFLTVHTDWQVSDRAAFTTTAASLGEAFLKPYIVPFEVASVLLATAMIGAIILSREETSDRA